MATLSKNNNNPFHLLHAREILRSKMAILYSHKPLIYSNLRPVISR